MRQHRLHPADARLVGFAPEQRVQPDQPVAAALKAAHLLGKDSLRAELGARAQSFVTEHHSWNHMAAQFGQVVESVNRPPAPAVTPGPASEPLAKAQL